MEETLEMSSKKKEGMLDLDSFVAEQLKLLQLEREAEIAEASSHISLLYKLGGKYTGQVLGYVWNMLCCKPL